MIIKLWKICKQPSKNEIYIEISYFIMTRADALASNCESQSETGYAGVKWEEKKKQNANEMKTHKNNETWHKLDSFLLFVGEFFEWKFCHFPFSLFSALIRREHKSTLKPFKNFFHRGGTSRSKGRKGSLEIILLWKCNGIWTISLFTSAGDGGVLKLRWAHVAPEVQQLKV